MSHRTITSIALALAVTCAGPAQAEDIVNVEAIFNAGVQMGWLEGSFETGLFPGERPNYVAGTTLSFDAGFDVGPGWGAFPLRQAEAASRWTHMKRKVQYVGGRSRNQVVRSSLAIMRAGNNLGIAHINAQKGTCPSCVRTAMERAGLDLRATRVPGLVTLGNDLVNAARGMRVNSIPELQAYTGFLASTIVAVQNIL